MAYFQDNQTRDRIHILYFMKRMDTALTETQLASAFFENNWIGYFETQLLIHDMEERGLIAVVPCAFGQGYAVTPSGEDMLSVFSEQLPLSVRNDCDEYVSVNGEKLLRMEQFFARYTSAPAGGYNAVLRAFESDRMLMSVVINLPNAETAKSVCENWEESADKAYSALLKTLIPE